MGHRSRTQYGSAFDVSVDVKVEGKKLKAGKYGLFTIPGENEWIIIFNSVPDQWGSSNYDKTKDVLRVSVKPDKTSDSTERFTISIKDSGQVAMKWGMHQVNFKVSGR
jgi:hypothetical protein